MSLLAMVQARLSLLARGATRVSRGGRNQPSVPHGADTARHDYDSFLARHKTSNGCCMSRSSAVDQQKTVRSSAHMREASVFAQPLEWAASRPSRRNVHSLPGSADWLLLDRPSGHTVAYWRYRTRSRSGPSATRHKSINK